MRLRPLFADVLPNLKIAQPPNHDRPHDQPREKRCKACLLYTSSRSQQHHIARHRQFTRAPHRVLQRFRVLDFGRPLNLPFDLRRRRPNQMCIRDSLCT